jgi:pyruvate/2-oxoglutarate dehydrogenase complex dihydrolipoamide dehydrogenase (E3) component
MTGHGVAVRLSRAVDRALLEAEAPDALVIATGARPHLPAGLQLDSAHMVHASAVLAGANVRQRVVIADGRCDWVGLGLAERLARAGCFVRLAVNGTMPGQVIQQYMRDRWIGELHRLGVAVTPFARLVGADDTAAYFEHATSGQPILFEEVDTVVAATGSEPDLTLERAIAGWPGEVWIAGDALAPRSCEEAVLEGLKVATGLGGGPLAPADRPLQLRVGAI